jgi:pyruvate dehydrogenase E1 component alpha subunit
VTRLDDDTRLALFRRALLARRLEERIVALAKAGEIPATLHEGAGQEVCQLAALAALAADDPILYAHRGVAYWLARDLDPAVILCDAGNREGGTNGGRGNLMHVFDPARGLLGQSGTLGGNLVIGVGVALAEQRLRTGRVTVVFFGDGTANRGQFHEAANFAGLQRLPVVFLCENNGWGLSVPVARSTAVADIAVRAAGYGFPGVVVDGNDADAVFGAMASAAVRARAGEGPTLIEAKVNRLRAHYLGDAERYRDRSEEMLDPLDRLGGDVIGRGLLDATGVREVEAQVVAQIDDAVVRFRTQPLAPLSAARDGVFGAQRDDS